jgi:hypothetical protein
MGCGRHEAILVPREGLCRIVSGRGRLSVARIARDGGR